MNKKILCVCNKGICRSVATRYCLMQKGYRNVISIGWHGTTDATLKMLTDWADIILIAKPYHKNYIPNKTKVNQVFTIGDEIYNNNPMNNNLHKLINEQLNKIGL